MTDATKFAEPNSSRLSLMEGLGKFTGLVTAVLLVLSTAYDFSFLYALGLSFEELPSTLADHVRSAIVWVPKALVYVAIIVIFELLMRRVEGGMTEDELVASSPFPRFTRAFRRSPKILFLVLLPIIFVVDFFIQNSDQVLFIAAMVGWGFLVYSIADHPRLGANLTSVTARLCILTPIVVIWVASLGYTRGNSMMRAVAPTWSVELKGSLANDSRKLVGLRRFSTAAVLVEQGGRVSIVPADLIVRADALRQPGADTPRACRWLGIACGKPIAKQ